MATPRDSSQKLFAALSRLIGEPTRQVRHGALFRVKIVSADGKPYAATVQVDTHRKVPTKAAINDVADRLRLPRSVIDDVLAEWTSTRLIEHLSSLTHDELCSRKPVKSLRDDDNPALATAK